MKVAVIVERTDISLGGQERSVAELTQCLRSLGIDVDLIAAKGSTDSPETLILCNEMPGKRVTLAQFGTEIKKLLSERHYDIIHSTLPFDFADVYQPRGGCYRQAMLRNADSYPSAFTRAFKKITHWTNSSRYRRMRAEQALCRAGNKTIIAALSQNVRNDFLSLCGLADERIAVIANGVKLNTAADEKTAADLRNDWLAKLGISDSEDATLFLFAANNFRLKGLAQLIEAMAAGRKNENAAGARIIVAGSGNIDRFRSLAEKANVADRFLFLGSLKNTANAILAADAAILPTFYDPASRFIIEALATAKPVITTKSNGSADLFTDGIHGTVIDSPDNTAAMAEAIANYCDAAKRRAAIEAINADNLKENLSIERHCRRLVELYEKIVDGRG